MSNHKQHASGTVDVFAQIAESRIDYQERAGCLVRPAPAPLPDATLPLETPTPDVERMQRANTYVDGHRITNACELTAELKRWRERMAPFMADLAPPTPPCRHKLALCRWDWRMEDAADQEDGTRPLRGGGNWERTTIPHYGGPLGPAAAWYRTSVELSTEMLDSALMLCFGAVDYTATVFVNGQCVGTHEGFFAPFEFEISANGRVGTNVIAVRVGNDAIFGGNGAWEDGQCTYGDKLYAATGLGWDEPGLGWHHCPPGMGIYQEVNLEARAPLHIHDVFVRPLPTLSTAEVWLDIQQTAVQRGVSSLHVSVYGQNFRAVVCENLVVPLTQAFGPGLNFTRFQLAMPECRLWTPQTPWLYQIQIALLDESGTVLDRYNRQFGMRTFTIDQDQNPKGRPFLNGHEIRLRGANTMGHLQQCAFRRDVAQLRDDLLLAKIGHLNFLRITQRPVQPIIYDYCDRLGIMVQTDLPLFGVVRANQTCEVLRQVEEMERLIRHHPSCILISYINEPTGAYSGSQAHRHLTRDELESLFDACDIVVKRVNPDRTVKAIDGDYNPPGPGLPDQHCYNCWYNAHMLEYGDLHKGGWQWCKPGWFYACGEFGVEGLDNVDIMRCRYPSEWLPEPDDGSWTPLRIPYCQTGQFHHLWFDAQHSLEAWIAYSQAHQEFGVRMQTSAFRRDRRMVSFALHLLIDAFPAGWMKAVIDAERQPKPAFFAYRDCLTPLMINLRTDRLTGFAGDTIPVELWLCNDTHDWPRNALIKYQVQTPDAVIATGEVQPAATKMDSRCVGVLQIALPPSSKRTMVHVLATLCDASGGVVHDAKLTLECFPRQPLAVALPCAIYGKVGGAAYELAAELALSCAEDDLPLGSRTNVGLSVRTILLDDPELLRAHLKQLLQLVANGATLLLLNLPEGSHTLDETMPPLLIEPLSNQARQFVSRATNHVMVSDFCAHDFRLWYSPDDDCIRPLARSGFSLPLGWSAIIQSGQGVDIGGQPIPRNEPWRTVAVVAECSLGNGYIRCCQLELAGRTQHNPVAAVLAQRLLGS